MPPELQDIQPPRLYTASNAGLELWWVLGGMAVAVLLGTFGYWLYRRRHRVAAPLSPLEKAKHAVAQLSEASLTVKEQWAQYSFILRSYLSARFNMDLEGKTLPELESNALLPVHLGTTLTQDVLAYLHGIQQRLYDPDALSNENAEPLNELDPLLHKIEAHWKQTIEESRS